MKKKKAEHKHRVYIPLSDMHIDPLWTYEMHVHTHDALHNARHKLTWICFLLFTLLDTPSFDPLLGRGGFDVFIMLADKEGILSCSTGYVSMMCGYSGTQPTEKSLRLFGSHTDQALEGALPRPGIGFADVEGIVGPVAGVLSAQQNTDSWPFVSLWCVLLCMN